MTYKYKKRINPKIIALIIEAFLIIAWVVIIFIFNNAGIIINNVLLISITVVLIFALLLTLSLIRYDAMREIRLSDMFKDNVPIYTDRTTLIGHDLKDEAERDYKDNKNS